MIFAEKTSVLQGHSEGDLFAGVLADHVSNSGAWLEAAVEVRVRPLVAPLVAKARADGAEISDSVRGALEIPELRSSVLRAITQEEDELDDLAHAVIDGLTDDDVPLIGELWVRESVTPMLRALLVHKRTSVRALAAVAFGEEARGHGPALPDELRPAWRVALVGAVPAQLPQHSRWRLGEILKHAVTNDPDLCADWCIANAGTPGFSSRARRLVESFSEVLRALPRDQKRRIVTTLGTETLISSGFAGDVLGADAELATELLAEDAVDGLALLQSMSGHRDHTIEALVPALITAQVPPSQIIAKALSNRSWIGAESDAILEDLEFFAKLKERRPEAAEVCALAAEQLGKELEAARAKEEQDRLRGW